MRHIAVLGLVTLASCFQALDAPTPPNLDDLVRQYEDPTGSATPELLTQTSAGILNRFQEVQRLGLEGELLSLVNTFQSGVGGDPDEPGGGEIGGLQLSGLDGVFDVRRVCPGWNEDPIPDVDETGMIDLTLLLVAGSFSRVVFGTAERCRFINSGLSSEFQVEFTGEFAADIERPLPPGELLGGLGRALENRALTIRYRGAATIDGVALDLDSNFRRNVDEQLEISVVLDENRSNFVYFFSQDGSGQGIRDVTGSLACDLEERRCQGPTGSFTW